jgi:hypothetical protein
MYVQEEEDGDELLWKTQTYVASANANEIETARMIW